MDERSQRILENERAFRVINQRLRADLERSGEDGEVLFVCECGHTACHESVRLTSAEYADVHVREDQFVTMAGHVLPEVEDVVESTDRYVVVRKHET